MWDLKLKRSVINFTDPNNRSQRNSVVAWSPDVATRVIVASEDDRNPVLQVWDLRNAFAPLVELRGHHKGILSASWEPESDGSILGVGEFKTNVGRIKDGLKRTRETAELKDEIENEIKRSGRRK